MSQNKTSTSTNQFDPQSMNRYQGAQNALISKASQMWQDPFSNPMYNMGLQMQMNAANTLNAGVNRNAMSNFQMSGMGNLTGGARASLLSGLSRQSAGTRQQGFFNNFQNAQSNMWNSASLLSSIQPLGTGQTNVQKTSGLGTWLPQLAGAAIGAGMGMMTGGMTGGGGKTPMGGGFGSGQMPSQLNGLMPPG